MLDILEKNTAKEKVVVTRFAPSPTGKFHAGGYRTAIFNYLYAKKMNGKFILRIEDTDKVRSKSEYLNDILENVAWLDLMPDEVKLDEINYLEDEKTKIKYILQSQRLDRHKYYLQKMIDMNLAYISKEKSKINGKINEDLEVEVIRFRNPNKIIQWDDLVRGEIKMDTTDLGDFVIARNIQDPLYHLAVVIDDFESGVTHIIRGEDHIPNTPRQILIKEAIEKISGIKKDFIYAHIPLVLGTDRLKLSKRRGAMSMSEYRDLGYLKEAILNFVCLIGWNPGSGEEREIFSKEELEKIFSLEKTHKAGAILNLEKLNWFNKEYIKLQNPETQLEYIKKFLPDFEKYGANMLEKMQEILINRISHYSELKILSDNGELDFYLVDPVFSNIDSDINFVEKIIWKKSSKEKTLSHLKKIIEILEQNSKSNLDLDLNSENQPTLGLRHDKVKNENTLDKENESKKENHLNIIWTQIENLAAENGKGGVLWPLRYALSGKEKSPDPKSLLKILGIEKSLQRIRQALNALTT